MALSLAPVTIEVNGERREMEPGSSLAGLIEELGLKQRRVAVEHNRAVVPRDDWETTPLAENDRVEVVQFVGGG